MTGWCTISKVLNIHRSPPGLNEPINLGDVNLTITLTT
jgi:hypothetical protein